MDDWGDFPVRGDEFFHGRNLPEKPDEIIGFAEDTSYDDLRWKDEGSFDLPYRMNSIESPLDRMILDNLDNQWGQDMAQIGNQLDRYWEDYRNHVEEFKNFWQDYNSPNQDQF